ncbi:MAG TPA: anti-sigma factor [Candidatus Angelobacter sp.]|jgi:anti-sigma factor RsiW|nr:anti-sigma factor [Candidatus Angelobacter sp.]
MQCRDSKKILGAYVDNEIDVMQSAALEEHLAVCEDCRAFMDDQRTVKNLVQQGNFRFSVPSGFYEQIRKSLDTRSKEDTRPKKKLQFWPGAADSLWRITAAVATAATLVLAVALGVLLHRESVATHTNAPNEAVPAQIATAQNEVVDNHIRSLLADHLADVASTDQHTVKPWFNGKLNFSPKVADFSDQGFPLIGGRLDYMEAQRVAALIYKRRQHVINVFTYPHGGSVPLATNEQRGFHTVHWADSGMEYWVISDVNAAELRQFADLLRQ